jgi:hypothetical protein
MLLFGNSGHHWVRNLHSLAKELSGVGFIEIEVFLQNSCDDEMYLLPEIEGNFPLLFSGEGLILINNL